MSSAQFALERQSGTGSRWNFTPVGHMESCSTAATDRTDKLRNAEHRDLRTGERSDDAKASTFPFASAGKTDLPGSAGPFDYFARRGMLRDPVHDREPLGFREPGCSRIADESWRFHDCLQT
jgi:hypothetical protein